MKLLKHILVVFALLLTAMTCAHASDHGMHKHGDEKTAEICATHHCACHTCGEVPCTDDLETWQTRSVASTPVDTPATTFTFFICAECKLLAKQAPTSVSGILATLQTVQLLI